MADHTVPTTRDGGCNRKAAHELASLHTKLRSERLLVGSVDAVGSELYVIQRMNTKAQTQLDELQRLIWTCRHERTLLRRLINSDPEVRPNNCCQLVAELGSSDFKEAYRPLGHHAELLAHILQSLSDAPKAVAELTAAAEKLGQKASSEFISSVFNVLYGSCAFPREERAMLELLSRLISLQLAGSAEPRKLLRKGNIAFCRLYRLFMDELSEARVFLTAALHEPVMFLLSQDDFFLDVDPEKLAIRYPAHERAQRFGRDPTSPSYRERLAQHRRAVVDKLAAIGQRFIDSLRKAMSSCFPQSLRWLVCELNKTLLDAGKVSRSEATLIVTDLVFTNFLCAAIINPEPLGIITDTPVGHIARFNLIQIGQILQTLALLPYEKPAAHFDELLSKLDWSAIPGTIADLLNSNAAALEEIVPQLVSSADGREIYRRKACIGTRVEADAILAVLKSPALEEITDAALKRTLRSISKKLPARLMPLIAGAEEVNSLGGSLCDSPPPHRSHSSGRLKNLADRVQNAASKGHQRLLHSPNSPFHKPMEGANRGDRLAQSSSSSNFQNVTSPPQYNTHVGQRNGGAVEGNLMRPEVCVFPLGGTDGEVPIGMESEEYVMQMAVSCAKSTAKSSAERKQTRFTTASESVVSDRTNEQVSDDEVEGAVQVRESGTATSGVDPTEGSSCSSSNENPVDGGDLGEDAGEGEEEEDISTLPDNFSDVAPISANVSARGSNASLSGDRADTPLSGAGAAAANGGDANGAPNERPNGMGVAVSGATSAAPDVARRTLPAIPVTIKKQNREGLEEKFGKFTLPPQDRTRYHDETYSLVSDSWSTDVGAPSVTSDNEGLNETRNELVLPPPASSAVPTAALNAQPHFPHGSASVGNLAPSTPLLGASILPAAASHGSAHNSANALNATPSSASLQPVASTSNSSQSQPLPEVSASSSAPNSATALNNEQPYYDPRNPTTCKAFGDAKRKLRLVLSSASTPPPASHTTVAVGNGTRENGGEMDEIAKYLKLLLAEAINGRDEAMCAQISEVLRCVRYTTVFDSSGMRKLMKALRDEHRARADYLAYLRESRLTLLKLNSQLNRAKMRFSRERCLTSECLVEVLVRFYLEMKEGVVRNFVSEFQSCKAQDEKTDAVSTALLQLCEDLSLEPMWRNASEENLEYAQKSLERALIAHVYHFALYPNGDADVCRDDVFFSSMLRLQCQVKVEREELGIARRFHGDAPWPLAQDQLRIVNAYKSPRDKMACIVRCCETIESLVLMNSERKSACADDILPIAVFVLIQSNPPSLLSNIQYIHDFYSSAMQGKEAYWWTQFTSAVEFTKQLMNRIA